VVSSTRILRSIRQTRSELTSPALSSFHLTISQDIILSPVEGPRSSTRHPNSNFNFNPPRDNLANTTNQSSLNLDATRCFGTGSPIYEAYHDEEWGIPIHDDRHLFELLILEGAQAGLSWETILKRRDAYRLAFDNFEIEKVANYDEAKIAELLQDEGIIRNKLKVNATIKNANVALAIQNEHGSLKAYFWSFVLNSQPLQTDFASMNDVPAGATPESIAMSKDLKKRGMTFVGPTITYAFMQSGGMTNDHQTTCPRHQACKELSKT